MSKAKRAVAEVMPEEQEEQRSPLREVLAKPVGRKARAPRLEGVVSGSLAGWDEDGRPLVEFPGNPTGAPVCAVSTAALDKVEEGAELALLFEGCDPTRPVIVGLIQTPVVRAEEEPEADPVRVEMDGEQLVFSAEREIVLRCGKASITLTRAGKVLIKGAYLLNRSTGVNRVKGGSVQIN